MLICTFIFKTITCFSADEMIPAALFFLFLLSLYCEMQNGGKYCSQTFIFCTQDVDELSRKESQCRSSYLCVLYEQKSLGP